MPTSPTLPRRGFIVAAVGALTVQCLEKADWGSSIASRAEMTGQPEWLEALMGQASWMEQRPDGRWHLGAPNLEKATDSLMRALGARTRVWAEGQEFRFSHGGVKHRVVFHHIA